MYMSISTNIWYNMLKLRSQHKEIFVRLAPKTNSLFKCLAQPLEPNFMALLTVSKESALAEAGNSALTWSAIPKLAATFDLCARAYSLLLGLFTYIASAEILRLHIKLRMVIAKFGGKQSHEIGPRTWVCPAQHAISCYDQTCFYLLIDTICHTHYRWAPIMNTIICVFFLFFARLLESLFQKIVDKFDKVNDCFCFDFSLFCCYILSDTIITPIMKLENWKH